MNGLNISLLCRILCFLGCVIISGPLAADESKKGILKQKLMDISALNTHVSQKISKAILVRDELKAARWEFVEEIRNEKRSKNIHSFEAAQKVTRIKFNIKLIQRINTYIQRLERKISYFKTGKKKLEFYHAQVTDEIKLIEILDDMEIRALINNVDRLINIYAPETQKPLLDAGNISFDRPVRVWNAIISEDF